MRRSPRDRQLMKAAEQAKHRRENMRKHRDMILNPWNWPCYPSLPLKRRVEGNNWPQLAILVASEECVTALDSERIDPNCQFRVYVANLFQKINADTPAYTYPNVDALLAAGWEVD